MDVRKAAQLGADLLRSLAKEMTTVLEAGREQLGEVAESASERAKRLLDTLKERSEDALAYLDPNPWLEDVYATLGIASVAAVSDLDERIDYVELRVEEVARQRAREELMLLQQRIAELESVLSEITDADREAALGGLLTRLAELEERIESIPWRQIEPQASARA